MSGDLLSVPWHLGGSPDSRGAFADSGEGVPVMTVFAKSHELAVHVTALHNAEVIRREALAEEERLRREKALGSRLGRLRHWLHRGAWPELHPDRCWFCRGAKA